MLVIHASSIYCPEYRNVRYGQTMRLWLSSAFQRERAFVSIVYASRRQHETFTTAEKSCSGVYHPPIHIVLISFFIARVIPMLRYSRTVVYPEEINNQGLSLSEWLNTTCKLSAWACLRTIVYEREVLCIAREKLPSEGAKVR